MPKPLPLRRLDEPSESALRALLDRPTCRVCRPVKITGDEATTGKLRDLVPLWEGLVLAPCPNPDVFEADLLEAAPNAPALAFWAAGEIALLAFCGQPGFHLPPVLLHGPPGTGKTTAARLLARIAAAPFHVVNVAASSDARTLLGTSAGYSTGSAGLAARIMARTRRANPILIVDEIDKARGDDRAGSWKEGLLPFLEPTTSQRVFDEFLMRDVDCSRITWIATANDLDAIPTPLLSRFHKIEVAPQRANSGIDPLVLRGLAEEMGLDDVKELLDVTALPHGVDRLPLRAQRRIVRLILGQALRARRLQ